MSGDQERLVEVSGREVHVSSPDKVYFPELGATKFDLVSYYLLVADALLNTAGGRPAMLQRFPHGATGKSFFQKRVPSGAPTWLETTTVATPNGTTSNALVVADIAHVVWAVNLGCLGLHLWPYLAANPDVRGRAADRSRSPAGRRVRRGAHRGLPLPRSSDRARLGRLPEDDRQPWPAYLPASGSTVGRHGGPRRPRWRWPESWNGGIPTLITANWWKEERGERVFVDFNQNAPHKTVFAAWFARPRTGGQVSTPLSWDQVADVVPDDLTIRTVPDLLRREGDPWSDIGRVPQSLQPLLDLAERDKAAGLHDAPWPPEYPKGADEPTRVAPSRAKKS